MTEPKPTVVFLYRTPDSVPRMVLLANRLGAEFNLWFAGPGARPEDCGGYPALPLSLGDGGPTVAVQMLEKAFLETVSLLRERHAEWVVTDHAVPVGMAAEFCRAWRCQLMGDRWENACAGETSDSLGLVREGPLGGALRSLRKKYGLRPLRNWKEEAEGDLNLAAVPRELWKGTDFPSNTLFSTGPEESGLPPQILDAFRDSRRRVVCALCEQGTLRNSRDIRSLHSSVRHYARERFSYWRCVQCGSLHLLSRTGFLPDESVHPKLFRTVNYVQLQYFRKLRRFLQKNGLGRESRILLVGADARLFSACLALSGYRKVEILPDVNCLDGDFPAESYDGGILLDAVARAIAPRNLLTFVSARVRPDGVLIVIDPDADGLVLDGTDRDGFQVEAPFRYHIVSKNTLAGLVKNEGFSLIRLKRQVFIDTWTPFLNYRFIVALSRVGDSTVDAAVDPPPLSWANAWRLPWLAWVGFFGRLLPYRGIVTAVFRKGGPVAPPPAANRGGPLDAVLGFRDIVGLNLGKVSVLTRRKSMGETRFIFREIFQENCYFRNGITLPPDATVVDVGANIGLFGLAVLSQVPRGRLICFEPVPETFQLLTANLYAHAGRGQRLILRQLAVSDQGGAREITYYPGMPGNSTLSPERKIWETAQVFENYGLKDAFRWDFWTFLGVLLIYPFRKPLIRLFGQKNFLGARTIHIRAVTLDQVFQTEGLTQVDLLKVDTEGEEMAVLEGLSDENLGRLRGLVVELSVMDRPRWPALKERLTRAGLTNIVVENPHPNDPSWPDVVYATRGEAGPQR